MRDYHLGRLDDRGRQILGSQDHAEGPSPDRVEFLQPRHWVRAPLSAIRSLSRDTKVFTFKLDHEKQTSGLPVGQHLMMRLKDPATQDYVLRAYTPISEISDKGSLDILVKLYSPVGDIPGGRMSMALDGLSVGDEVDFKGPVGRFEYLGSGKVAMRGEERMVKSFVMICGGSGITPIYQVFRAVLQDRMNDVSCTVLDGNRQEEDILLRDELETLASRNGHRCRVVHTLTKGGDGWAGLRGRISEQLLQEEASPEEGKIALLCGPPGLEAAAKSALLKMGWCESDMLTF